MKRIFVAINLPEEIKNKIGEEKKEIKELFPEELRETMFKWVKKENLHITLLFIGYINEKILPQLNLTVKKIIEGFKSFSLKLEKITYGPPASAGRPKIIPPRLIWLDIEKKPDLLELAQKLKQGVEKTGILNRYEKREFSPHITLARIKTWQWRKIEPEERPKIDKKINLNFEVNSIEIMESKLKRGSSEYTVLESFKLT